MNFPLTSLLFSAVIAASVATEVRNGNKCGPCDRSRCRPPGECLAGTVKDSCGCCFVCGLKEGERCHEKVCGENMECRMRTDLPPDDAPEALCFCVKQDPICGSDGQTYSNVCQLTEARYKLRNGLIALSRGPCKAPPKIVSPPEDVRNLTGRFVALSCEAQGYPVPVIEWRVDKGDGQQLPMPSDDSHVAVQSRGGPSPYEVTSWLQFLRLVPQDQATYWCVAINEMGEDAASANVRVLNSSYRRSRVRGGWKGGANRL